jgi:hypothetical protein
MDIDSRSPAFAGISRFSAAKVEARIFTRSARLCLLDDDHVLGHGRAKPPAARKMPVDPDHRSFHESEAQRRRVDELDFTTISPLPHVHFHIDLRHPVITELAEMGVADHVLESITGHPSYWMPEPYSGNRSGAQTAVLALARIRHEIGMTRSLSTW